MPRQRSPCIIACGVRFYRLETLAQELGCCRETVLRTIRRHRVPTLRTRRGYLVHAGQWEQMLGEA